jgi:transposase
MKRYKVTLSDEERARLERMVSTGRRSAQMLVRARILLKADEAHEAGWTDQEIVEALDVGLRTVERTRQALVEEGLEAALSRQKRSRPGNVKFDGQKEAQLITLACSQAPDGRARWTLQLLADKMVELKVFESISTEAVRQVLKKTSSSRG